MSGRWWAGLPVSTILTPSRDWYDAYAVTSWKTTSSNVIIYREDKRLTRFASFSPSRCLAMKVAPSSALRAFGGMWLCQRSAQASQKLLMLTFRPCRPTNVDAMRCPDDVGARLWPRSDDVDAVSDVTWCGPLYIWLKSGNSLCAVDLRGKRNEDLIGYESMSYLLLMLRFFYKDYAYISCSFLEISVFSCHHLKG